MEAEALKQCTRCSKRFPRTNEFFYRSTSSRDGLQSRCKTCDCNKGRTIDAREQKKCSQCKKRFTRSLEHFYRNKTKPDGLQARCKSCCCKVGLAKPGRTEPRVGKYCPNCMGLPHRRPKRGLCRCGESYRPEPPARADATARKPLEVA